MKQLLWGSYHKKPIAQMDFDRLVIKACQKVAAESDPGDHDFRPRAKDLNSNTYFLVDTGAAVSVYPRSMVTNAKCDVTRGLEAVNGTKIPTFGNKRVKVRFDQKTFEHEMVVADVETGILGFDFLLKFRFDLLWTNSQCVLFCAKSKSTYPLHLGKISRSHLNLSPVSVDMTFAKYSQSQKSAPVQKPIPPAFQELLNKHSDVTKCKFLERPKHGVTHHIDTKHHPPCRSKMRPLLKGSPKEIIVKKRWFELVDLGILTKIEPGEPTTWSSALHLAPKDGNDLRVCSDFCPLNDLTTLDHYPLPSLRAFSSQLQGAKVFSKIDLRRAFYHVPLDLESSMKTVTLTPWGAFRYNRLAMGLRNAPQSFQKLMDHITAGMSGVFVYMDDIMCFSRDMATHLQIVDELLKRLNDNGLALHLSKCKFGAEKLEFLGYHVDGRGIKPLPKKVEAIVNFPPPKSKKCLLGFLGSINFYRRALPNSKGRPVEQVLQPLYDFAVRKRGVGEKFEDAWTAENMSEHYNAAKQLLIDAANLTHPDPNLPLAITTDSSKTCIGAVLEQYEDNQWRPMGYFSKHLPPQQQKWSTFRRELLAAKEGIRHFIAEIDGRHCVLFTDHRPLLSAFSSNSMQHDVVAQNHIQEICQWTKDVRFLPGKTITVADHLSRPSSVPLGTAYQVNGLASSQDGATTPHDGSTQ